MTDWKTGVAIVKANRQRRGPKSAIEDIPRYDWLADPKRYCIDGIKPKERCFHCGWKYLGYQITPFCLDCYTALWLGNPTEMSTKVRGCIRVPDDYNFETNQIERRDDKLGSS